MNGEVLAIFINPKPHGALVTVKQVQAVEARGLEGDHHFRHYESTAEEKPDAEVTLIEMEALEALQRDYKVELKPEESRRNLLTRGAALNHLVGKTFAVGEAVLRGIRLCEPCAHLESLTRPGVLKGMIHRCGLRAQVVQSGAIRMGDAIRCGKTSFADY